MQTLHKQCAGLDVHKKEVVACLRLVARDARIEAALAPFRDTIERLKEVPGLSETSAQILLAEIGTDMSQFQTAGHLLSWAGLVPRLDESAGKHRLTRVKKGASWLKPVLVQCAWAASRKKNSYFHAQFLRLKNRSGPKKAAIAVAASILTTAYHMLADGACYHDLGNDHFTRRDPAPPDSRLSSRHQGRRVTGQDQFLDSHKAVIFGTAVICEQGHEGDSRIGTGWRAWIAWLWRGVACVLQPLSRV